MASYMKLMCTTCLCVHWKSHSIRSVLLKGTNQMLVINRYTDPNTLKVTLYGHILKGGTIQQSLGRFDESLLKQVTRGYKFYLFRDVLKVPELKTVEIINK